MRRDRLEAVLDELARIRKDPHSPASLAGLRRVLGRESSHAVARAALMVAESQLDALVPDLVAAFQRFLEGPAKLGAIAALRRDEGFDFLLSLVGEADLPTARDALAALAQQRDASLDERVREAVAGRDELAGELERLLTDRPR